MKTKINKMSYWLVCTVLVTFSLSLLSACSDSDSVGGTPEITGVRKTDPEKADSLFTKAHQGQMILIMGKNLQNILKVYINDQTVYFNPTENTDHSVIVTIPTEENDFKLTTWDSDLKDEIRIETDHGTATYAFKVLNPAPYLLRIAGDYPRSAGSELQLYGMNLLDVEHVYMTDATPHEIDSLKTIADSTSQEFVIPGNRTEVTQYSLKQDHYLNNRTKAYETASVMDFTLPSINYKAGSMVVECAAGTTWVEFASLPPKPVLLSMSSDMPMTGEKVTLTGRNFIGVEAVKYGDVTIPASDLYVAESEDSIVFTMGAKPDDMRSTLSVVTLGGEDTVPFYEYERVLIDFDGKGINNGWDPGCLIGIPEQDKIPYTGDGQYANIRIQDNGWNWWGMMCYFRAGDNGATFQLPGYDLIPADTPTDNVYLAFECYNNNCLFENSVHIHYLIQTANSGDGEFVNWSWDTGSYLSPVLSDIDEDCPVGKWYRTVLPMSKINIFAGKTYQDIVNAGITNIRLMEHNYTGNPMFVDLYFDNIRLINIKK